MHDYNHDPSLEEKAPLLPISVKEPLLPLSEKPNKPEKPVYKLQSWMADLPSDMPISGISLPGTHDSAAYTTTWPFISTQNLSIKSQLYAGIRYFDFRCGGINDHIEMVHGSATLGLKLSDILDDIYSWLKGHQTEALIIQIKQDRKPDKCTKAFSDLIVETLGQGSQYWRTESTTPTLGELRGKIQLLRRFTGDRLVQYGINVSRWQDNPETPFTIHTYPGVNITIQDHYSFSSPQSLPSLVAKKGVDIADMLARAQADSDPNHWYINFTSAFEFNVVYQINPRQIALGGYWVFRWVEGVNLRLFNSLKAMAEENKGKKKRLGVVVMDFPEAPTEELIQIVVDTNFEEPKPPVDYWRVFRTVLLGFLALVGLCAMLAMRCVSYEGSQSAFCQ